MEEATDNCIAYNNYISLTEQQWQRWDVLALALSIAVFMLGLVAWRHHPFNLPVLIRTIAVNRLDLMADGIGPCLTRPAMAAQQWVMRSVSDFTLPQQVV